MQKNKPEDDELFREVVGKVQPLKYKNGHKNKLTQKELDNSNSSNRKRVSTISKQENPRAEIPPFAKPSEIPSFTKPSEFSSFAKPSEFPPFTKGGAGGILSSASSSPLYLSDNYIEALEPEAIIHYIAPGVSLSPSLIQKIQRGEYPLELTIDLHGDTIDSARDKLSLFLQQAYEHQQRGLLIIHGKGRHAILKNHVIHWLKQISWVLFFCSAQPKKGGAGALYVLLKRKKAVCESKDEIYQKGRLPVAPTSGIDTGNNLIDIRKKIDELDSQISALICERFAYAKKTAKLKKAILDSKREQDILKRMGQQATQSGIPSERLEAIYLAILSEMKKYQESGNS
jgi:DNA-nicking Smr family endonuclease/chorismate mutase